MSAKSNHGETLFSWWIDNHQAILRPLLGDDLRIKYYGGFALNVRLAPPVEARRSLLNIYEAGTDVMIAKHRASDIDMKLFGLPDESLPFLMSRLLSLEVRPSELEGVPHCVPEPWKGVPALTRDSAKNYIEIVKIPGELPNVKAIIAHLFIFPTVGSDAQETGIQIIIKGIYKNKFCQTLSEITCFKGNAQGDTAETPSFQFLPIKILCNQFITQFKNLSRVLKDKDRLEKTFDRISKCLLFMRENGIAFSSEQQDFWDGNAAKIEASLEKPVAPLPALLQPPPEGGAAAAPVAVTSLPLSTAGRSQVALSFVEQIRAKAEAAKRAAMGAGASGGGLHTRRRHQQSRRKD
jgi:hypothetical protein